MICAARRSFTSSPVIFSFSCSHSVLPLRKACSISVLSFATRFNSASNWSFTDCVSFHTMKGFRLRDALTKDTHFEEAGYVVLLK